jgi:hypothetical protein
LVARVLTGIFGVVVMWAMPASAEFRAGAATANVSPWLGLSINGGMSDNPTTHVHDELHARAVVLDDGKTKLAFVVVDSCMVPREVVAAAKARIQERSAIDPGHVLISATHAHSAPAATPVFQTDPDPAYVRFLAVRIADAVAFAVNNLAPAKVGWGMGKNADHLFNRRWKKKPGTIPVNPFGSKDDQAQMNPPPGSPDLIEPAGPTDPEVGVLSVQTPDGAPIAILSAYGLHYVGGVGGGHASADYYGAFARKVGELLKAGKSDPPFVAAMANGTSGDVNNINFRTPRPAAPAYAQIHRVADDLAAEVVRVAQSMTYHDHITLDAKTAELSLGVRRPDAAEVARAEAILAAANGKPLQSMEQVYARETVLIAKYPAEVPLTIQCLRVGDLGIAAIPCEVFTEIGLEIKAKSPLKPTFTIELANGYNGYLPTKAQHALGGYETWRARSSYLEVDAASRITATVLQLLDDLKANAPKSETP